MTNATATNSNSILRSIGSGLGKTAAYAWEGSRLASTQLAIGAAEGYAQKAEQLRAQRLALAPAAPALPARQRKVAA